MQYLLHAHSQERQNSCTPLNECQTCVWCTLPRAVECHWDTDGIHFGVLSQCCWQYTSVSLSFFSWAAARGCGATAIAASHGTNLIALTPRRVTWLFPAPLTSPRVAPAAVTNRFGYRANSLKCLNVFQAPTFEHGHQQQKAPSARAGSAPAAGYPHTTWQSACQAYSYSNFFHSWVESIRLWDKKWPDFSELLSTLRSQQSLRVLHFEHFIFPPANSAFYPQHQLSHYWSNIFHQSISVPLVL